MRRALVTGVLALVLAACAGDPAPARTPADEAACAAHAQRVVLLRREADTYATMPVAPVRVALVLAATWEFYNASWAKDPALSAAMGEVAAAIGDLDAQGKAATPPGGSLMDPVRLDVTRVRAAADAVDRACTP